MGGSGALIDYGVGLGAGVGSDYYGTGLEGGTLIRYMNLVSGDEAVVGKPMVVAHRGGNAVDGTALTYTDPNDPYYFAKYIRDPLATNIESGWSGLCLDTVAADSGTLVRVMFRGYFSAALYEVSAGNTISYFIGEPLMIGTGAQPSGFTGFLVSQDDTSAGGVAAGKVVAYTTEARATTAVTGNESGSIGVIYNGIEGF